METTIKLHPDVCKRLKEKTPDLDLEKLINDIALVYAEDGFIRRSDVAGLFVVNEIYRKLYSLGAEAFDDASKEFKGVVVTGKSETEALFIPSKRLHDLVEKNQVIVVMKSGRTQGIRVEEVNEIFMEQKAEDLV